MKLLVTEQICFNYLAARFQITSHLLAYPYYDYEETLPFYLTFILFAYYIKSAIHA